MVLLLTAILLCSCSTGVMLDDTIVLGGADEINKSFYRVADAEHSELELLHVEYRNGTVLITTRNYLGSKDNVKLAAYNVRTGESSDELSFDASSAFKYKSGFSHSGDIFTFDAASNALSLYNGSLALQKKMNFIDVSFDEIFVDSSYAYGTSGNSLIRVNLTNNSHETIAELDGTFATSVSFLGAHEDKIFLAGAGEDLALRMFVFDKTAGECYGVGEYAGKLVMSGQYIVNDPGNEKSLFVYDLARPGISTELFFCDEREMLLGVGEGFVCTSVIEGEQDGFTQTLRVYSLARGTVVSSTKYSYNVGHHQTNIREVQFIDSSYAVFELIDKNKSDIVIWDFAADVTESDDTLHIFGGTSDKFSAEYKKKCEEIYEKYGIEILSGDASVRYYPDYVALPEYSAKKLCDAVDEVKITLEKFPEGFFDELLEKSYYDNLKIVLADSLIPSHAGSMTIASGYYTGLGDTQYILLSLFVDDIENTLAHELFHAVEDIMCSHSLDEFGEWKKYNPEGYEYKNSYVDANGNEYTYDSLYQYTYFDPASGTDVNNIYFFDHYSQAFEREDRARVFERMMHGESSRDFESIHIMAKAKYLCERLDLFFDSVNDGTVEQWEKLIK